MKKNHIIIALLIMGFYSCKKADKDVCVDCYDIMQQSAAHEYFCGTEDAAKAFVDQYQKTPRYRCKDLSK